MSAVRRIAATVCLVGAVAAAACTPPETPGGPSSTAGRIDRAFAAGFGWEDIDIGSGFGTADIVHGPPVVLEDGTIVVAVETTIRPNATTPDGFDFYPDVHLRSFRADGFLQGLAVLPIVDLPDGSPGGPPLTSMAASPGNTVVITSSGFDRADRRFVYRYTNTLAPDATFGAGGAVELPATLGPWTVGHVQRIAVDSQGRVVLLVATVAPTPGVLAVRLTPTGALDPTFGTGGWTALPDALASSHYSVDLDVDSADRMVTEYVGTGGTSGLRRIVRLTTDGTADPAFTPIVESSGGFQPLAVTLDGSDRLLLLVQGGTGPRIDRYTVGGQPDLTFGGGDGSSDTFDRALSDIQIQPNGRILALMGWNDGELRAYMEVLEPDGTTATSVGSSGLLELHGARVAANETNCQDLGACVFPAFALTASGTRILLLEQQYVDQVVIVRLYAP